MLLYGPGEMPAKLIRTKRSVLCCYQWIYKTGVHRKDREELLVNLVSMNFSVQMVNEMCRQSVQASVVGVGRLSCQLRLSM